MQLASSPQHGRVFLQLSVLMLEQFLLYGGRQFGTAASSLCVLVGVHKLEAMFWNSCSHLGKCLGRTIKTFPSFFSLLAATSYYWQFPPPPAPGPSTFLRLALIFILFLGKSLPLFCLLAKKYESSSSPFENLWLSKSSSSIILGDYSSHHS